MTPPNISFRQKSRKRYLLPTLLVLVAAGAGLFYVGSRGGSGGKKPGEKTPQVAFTVAGFAVYSEGKAVTDAQALPERTSIIQMFTDYYQTAFVDPKKWADPQFASLKALFSADAQSTFTRDVGSLTIGEGAADYARVVPGPSQIRMSVYYDSAAKPTLAIAAVHFAARATTKSRRPVDIVQDGTFRLQREGAGWQIISYQASATQDTPSPPPSPSGSPS